MKIRANSRLGYKFTVNWDVTVTWQILTELSRNIIILTYTYVNIIHTVITWLLDMKGRTWRNDVQTLILKLIRFLTICRCSRCRTLTLATGMNVFVGLSKCEGKFRIEVLLRFIRGPGISLSWCLFFLSDVLRTARWMRGNSYVGTADRQTDRPTLPQDWYWRNKFMFVAINVGIFSSLMSVNSQLMMRLSCSFN